MFSHISSENTNHTPQAYPDDDFIEVETTQFEDYDQLLGWNYKIMNFLTGTELPGEAHIKQVLGFFINHTYNASATDPRVTIALDKTFQLFEKDHTIIKIDNSNGALSTYYPAIIPFVNGELLDQNIIFENPTTQQELNELVCRAYRARCRQRFPVAVIMYNGKTICRSATLSGCGEVYGRMALDMIRPSNLPPPPSTDSNVDAMIAAQLVAGDEEWKILAEYHIADVALLKKLKVGTIVDLMVENRKHKMGLPVTSSEKYSDDNKYHSNFILLSLPFPGCEFFKEFYGHAYEPRGLHFDWGQSMCDAELNVPEYAPLNHLNIDWDNYKEWDLVKMTQNYIKYIIKYLEDNDAGVLIHCISGWDRTPLFISLIRISLWADGVIHKSLETHELLYLTLAYDWMLFGHHLADRLNKNEDILLYCFTVLKYLVDDEYSIKPNLNLQRTEGFPIFEDNERHYIEPPFSPASLGVFQEGSNDSMDFRNSPVSSIVAEASPTDRRSPVPMDEGDGVRVLYDEARALDDADRESYSEARALDDATCAQGDGSRDLDEEAYAQRDSSPVMYDEARALDVDAPTSDDIECPQSDSAQGLYDEARGLDEDVSALDFDASHSAEVPCCSRTQSRCGLESASTGSWQMVSATGSVRGSDSQSEVETVSSQGSQGTTSGEFRASRKVKLAQIRRLFYRCYYQTLSDRHVNYITHSGVMSVILSNLSEIAQVLSQQPRP